MSKPIDSVRLGTVQAAIWKNETATGVYYSVTFGQAAARALARA